MKERIYKGWGFRVLSGNVLNKDLPTVISNLQKNGYNVLECYYISDEAVYLKMRKFDTEV